MELEYQVITREQAVKLNELGVSAHSIWWWKQDRTPTNSNMVYYGVKQEFMPWDIYLGQRSKVSGSDVSFEYPAYTVAELGELLPDMLTTHLQYELVSIKEDDCWLIRYVRGNDMLDQHPKIKGIGGETEAKARAAMLIYLLENSLIKP